MPYALGIMQNNVGVYDIRQTALGYLEAIVWGSKNG